MAAQRRNGATSGGAGRECIGVVGAGWVGLVTAACFAGLGHRVVVRDIVPGRIDDLSRGRVPIYEPGLADLLRRNRRRLRFTLELEDVFAATDVVFVSVGTPPLPSGDADLSAVWSVVEELPEAPRPTVLVMKSTVPVGTGARVREALDARGLTDVHYVSNPEFLSEGSAVTDFVNPDRVVIGASSDEDAARVRQLYASFDAPIVETDVASAEMVKLASNAFLATRISFINEIANVCEGTGADVEEVARGMGLDRRIGAHFLRAGIGYGGSCFPKDVAALKQLAGNSGYHFQLLSAVIEVNELQKRRIVRKLLDRLGTLRGATIALLGLAFKPNTNDLRDASSLVIASRLRAEGARVRAWDPVAMEEAKVLLPDVAFATSPVDAATGADAVVVVTEWDDVLALPLRDVREAMRGNLVIDGRNALDPAQVAAAGLAYEAVGRPRARGHVPVQTRERVEAVAEPGRGL
jgi:UDPglucose 6-dehydrogenase